MNKKIYQLLIFTMVFSSGFLYSDQEQERKEAILHEKPSQVPEKVVAHPEVADETIGERIEDILKTTGWFANPKVDVQKGVVFLYGETKNNQFKEWAGDLAHHTQDVAAVVNKIKVLEPSIWDFQMILGEFVEEGRKIVRAIPAVVIATLILLFFWVLARLVYRLIPHVFRDKMNPSLLHEVFARVVSFFVFVFGIYLVFEMADLTTMAVTILSGTGLLGIIVGIAFRDITENFLASVLLSVQNPFRVGDLVDIVAPTTGYTVTGYVECLTLRVTILVLLDGNHFQIPNATVYKSNIRNYSTNPNRREDFMITIGTHCAVSKAVESALKVLLENGAILKNPEPLVLVDSLTKDAVQLHIYYWVDVRKHNWLKIKSSVLRLIKQSFEAEGIETPLQTLLDKKSARSKKSMEEPSQTTCEAPSKGDSQIEKITGLSSQSRLPEGGNNLLASKRR